MTPQNIRALAKANEIRIGRAALKTELFNGELSMAEALEDPRAAGTFTVGKLIAAQRGYGLDRTRRFLVRIRLDPLTRIEDLNEIQRRYIVEQSATWASRAKVQRLKKQRRRERQSSIS